MGTVIEFPRELRDARFTFNEYRLLREHATDLMDHDLIESVETFITDEGDSVFAFINFEGQAVVTISKMMGSPVCTYVALDENGRAIAKGDTLKDLLSVFSQPYGGIMEA